MPTEKYAIIARMAVDHDGPLLYSVEGLERLAIARRQWAFLIEQKQEQRELRAKQKARGETIRTGGKHGRKSA